MADWPRTLKDAFCERYGCLPEQFVPRALKKCLPWRARLLGPFIRLLHPGHFHMDMEFIERAGASRNWTDLNNALGAFASNNRLRGDLYRNWLKLRVSGAKVIRLTRRLMEEAAHGR